jgi:ribose transport system ATP-binding protein
MDSPILEIDSLSKTFGSTRALEGASLTVMPGMVHGLVGQNGSGKSTLVKVLAGYHEADPGARITIDGSEVTGSLAGGGSRSLGLRFVHQDLGVVRELSVTENLFVDRFAAEPWGLLRWRTEHDKAAALLRSFGVDLDPRVRLAELSAAAQAMVVIVRAAEGLRDAEAQGGRRGVLVLDEATASLPLVARTHLRAVVREVVGLGHGVLFVSHFPDEVLDWADHVTVLRDGRVVADRSTEGMDENQLVELIIGRRIEPLEQASLLTQERGVPAVRVTGLRGSEIEELDFDIRPGEVLGITGLVGSGFDEVCRSLGGAAPARAGLLEIDGRRWDLAEFSPVDARRASIAYVPQDRQHQGAAPTLTVLENISLPILDRHRGMGDRIKHRQLRREVARLLQEHDVVPPDPDLPLRSLSGGNQQKVVIAKAMAATPRLLALVEPTQGVDVGARGEILRKLRGVVHRGTAVVCATTDAGQLEQLCDRVLVLRRGRLGAELRGDAINEDRILEETYRVAADAREAV